MRKAPWSVLMLVGAMVLASTAAAMPAADHHAPAVDASGVAQVRSDPLQNPPSARSEDEAPEVFSPEPLPENRGGAMETGCAALAGAPIGCALSAVPCLLAPILSPACAPTGAGPMPSSWQNPAFIASFFLFVVAPVYALAAPVLTSAVGSIFGDADPELVFKSLLFAVPGAIAASINIIAFVVMVLAFAGPPLVGQNPRLSDPGTALLITGCGGLFYIITAFVTAPLAAGGIALGAQINMRSGRELKDTDSRDGMPPRRKQRRRGSRRRASSMRY